MIFLGVHVNFIEVVLITFLPIAPSQPRVFYTCFQWISLCAFFCSDKWGKWGKPKKSSCASFKNRQCSSWGPTNTMPRLTENSHVSQKNPWGKKNKTNSFFSEPTRLPNNLEEVHNWDFSAFLPKCSTERWHPDSFHHRFDKKTNRWDIYPGLVGMLCIH